MRRSDPLASRLWAKIDQSAGPNACWTWTGAHSTPGTPIIRRGGGRPMMSAAIAVYEIEYGPLSPGHKAFRVCYQSGCMNPRHMIAATQAEIVMLLALSGRHYHGERHHAAKLNAEKVRQVRDLIHAGASQQMVADTYGISPRTVRDVATRHTWQDVI